LVAVKNGYFDGAGGMRQVLLWTVATRQALERWEASVATAIRLEAYEKRKPPGRLFWAAEIDRYWTFVAARTVLRALGLIDLQIEVDPELEKAVIQHRDLLEHWDENMPVFNISPRQTTPPRKSGKEYASDNPDSSPYGQIRWNGSEGPILGFRVPAEKLHRLLDAVQEEVQARSPSLAEYIPSRAPSPWLGKEAGRDRWFPKLLNSTTDMRT
jgi:hypothetical protein